MRFNPRIIYRGDLVVQNGNEKRQPEAAIETAIEVEKRCEN
jgi:hypothetical protein